MPKIQDTVRIVRKAEFDEQSVEYRAWLLWQAVRNAISKDLSNGGGKSRPMPNRDGVSGWRYDHSLRSHLVSLWPEIAQKASLLNDDSEKELSVPLYAYLRATGNAVCLVPHPPVWWVRDEFLITGQKAPGLIALPTRKAEDQLTPAEAGETREPGQVTVTHSEPETAMTEPRSPAQGRMLHAQAIAAAKKRSDSETRVLAALSRGARTAGQVVGTSGLSHTAVRATLGRLADAGLVAAVSTGRRVGRHEMLTYSVTAAPYGDSPAAPDPSRPLLSPAHQLASASAEDAVLAALARGARTVSDIQQVTGLSNTTSRDAAKQLVATGRVEMDNRAHSVVYTLTGELPPAREYGEQSRAAAWPKAAPRPSANGEVAAAGDLIQGLIDEAVAAATSELTAENRVLRERITKIEHAFRG